MSSGPPTPSTTSDVPPAHTSNKTVVIAASACVAVAALLAVAFIIFCWKRRQSRGKRSLDDSNRVDLEPKTNTYEAQGTFSQSSYHDGSYLGSGIPSPFPSPSPSPLAASHNIQPSAETLLLLQSETDSSRQGYPASTAQGKRNDQGAFHVRNGMSEVDHTSAPPAYEMLPQTPPPILEKPITLRYPGFEDSSSAMPEALAVPSGSTTSGDRGVRRAKSVA